MNVYEQNCKDLAILHKLVVRAGLVKKYAAKINKIRKMLDSGDSVQGAVHKMILNIYYSLPQKAFV